MGARRITGEERESLKQYFVDNRAALPSEKHREDLMNVDSESFGAGNLTGPGKSHIAYQQLAAKARHEADSVERLSKAVLDLQKELQVRDEKEAIKLGHTFRNEFGYINCPVVSENELSIILMDQPMVMLYHQTVKNDILFIDATGSVVKQPKYLKKILYYACVIPYNLSPPVPVAEFISSNQDQFAIRRFFAMIHEKEYQKYGPSGLTNPRLIVLDFSMALIQAALQEFTNESIHQYLDRTYRILTGGATQYDLQKSILHVCSFHVMRMCRRNAQRYRNREQSESSQVHFAMHLVGRIIQCKSLDEVASIIERAVVVMKTKYATSKMKEALQWLQESINTFEEPPIDASDRSDDEDEYKTSSEYSDDDDDDGSSDRNDIETQPVSRFKNYWVEKKANVQIEANYGRETNPGLNRYFMPAVWNWLNAKLPYISLWSNICLGNLNRFNSDYRCSYPEITTNNINVNNNTNAIAETFFSSKKRNKTCLKMPLPKFIRKCWEENRGLGRQFILGLKKGIKKDKETSRSMRSCYRSLKQLSGNINEVAGNNGFQDDNSILHRVEEQWEKGEKPQGVTPRQKSFKNHPVEGLISLQQRKKRDRSWKRMVKDIRDLRKVRHLSALFRGKIHHRMAIRKPEEIYVVARIKGEYRSPGNR